MRCTQYFPFFFRAGWDRSGELLRSKGWLAESLSCVFEARDAINSEGVTVHTCLLALRNHGIRRHHRLHNQWVQICQKAGCCAHHEELLPTMPGVCKRAHFVALALECTKFACGVMHTATATPMEHLLFHGDAAMKRPLLCLSSMMLPSAGYLPTPSDSCIIW